MASKYAAAHASPNGPGDARPTAKQIIKDEGLEGQLKGKVFLITGCSAGIGVETARAIAATGATVYCTARDLAKGKAVLADILEPGRVELLYMDLSSLAGVRTAAAEFLSNTKQLNVLICNAGVFLPAPGTTTADGFETQFGTNHLAHFLLFNLLKSNLLASSTPDFKSRVVMVSSGGHRHSGIHFDDYNFKTEGNPYTQLGAYGQSKTANIYMANYIDRHFGPQGINATSLHPGIIQTQLGRHSQNSTGWQNWMAEPKKKATLKSFEQGAATTVWASVSKEWEGKGGKYLENVQVSVPFNKGSTTAGFYYEHTYDEEKEERLWADSLKMVGLEQNA